MVFWSSLLARSRNPIKSFAILSKTPFLRNNVSIKIPVRNSHQEDMFIRPSRYVWELFKDLLHFYSCLGLIPVGAILFYCNVFIGPAKLAEIPEDYEPKHWEYYRHPVTRWISWWIPSDQEKYERRMHWLHEIKEQAKYDATMKRVKQLMEERLDFQGWYYEAPAQTRYLYQFLDESKDLEVTRSAATAGGYNSDG